MLNYKLEDKEKKEKADELNRKIEEDVEKEFKKTKPLLETLKRIIKFAQDEKWDLNYLIEELEVDVKNWRKSYNDIKEEN